MPQATETAADLFTQILDPANRPNPYPLYARLRETPVAPLADGFFAVSSYAEIAALLHDPRMSKDQRKTEIPLTGAQRIEPRPFLFLDPPEHDRLRRLVMRQFTPARVNAMHDRIVALVDELLDAHRDQSRLDVVDDFAYPLPVTVICELLGVPREDESRFHAWADTLAHSLDPDPGQKTDQAALHRRDGAQGLHAQADRRTARPAERRPALRSRRRRRPGWAHGRRQPRHHDDSAPDRRPRDDRQPDRQRHADLAAPSGRAGAVARPPGARSRSWSRRCCATSRRCSSSPASPWPTSRSAA